MALSLTSSNLKLSIREFKQRRRLRLRHEARILLVERGKVHVLPVKHEFPCISLPYSTNNNVKSPNLRFLRQHEHITMKQSFSVLTLKPFVPIQLQHNSAVLYKVNKREKLRNTCNSAKLYFGLRFLLP